MKNFKRLLSYMLMLIATTNSASAQVNNAAFQKKIFITVKEIRIDSLLKTFSRQTGVGFSFNSSKISASKKLVVPAKSQTLSQWLVILRQKMGVEYKLVGNHIILLDNKQHTAAKVKPAASKKPAMETKRNEPIVVELKDKRGDTIVAPSGSISQHRSSLSIDSPFVIAADTTQVVRAKSTDSMTQSVPAIVTPKEYKVGLKKDNTVKRPKSKDVSANTDDDYLPWSLRSFSKIDLGPQGLGYSHERRLSDRMIMEFNIGLGGGYAITGKQFRYKLSELHGPEIYASVTPRLYYNRQKRLMKGKTVDGNAGNYIGFRAKYVTDAVAENFVVWDALLFNFHWGMQRPVGNRWILNSHIGPGYGFAKNFFSKTSNFGLNHYYLSLDLKISYQFKKRS